jgi:hypothetical protein
MKKKNEKKTYLGLETKRVSSPVVRRPSSLMVMGEVVVVVGVVVVVEVCDGGDVNVTATSVLGT